MRPMPVLFIVCARARAPGGRARRCDRRGAAYAQLERGRRDREAARPACCSSVQADRLAIAQAWWD
eukprot:COSAG02_NODE_5132_length_4604_cov_2.147170_9_plen_66_part_00